MSLDTRTSAHPWKPTDSALLAALLVFCAGWLAVKIQWSWTPMEDAAMLLRYSQHFAQGQGIRWSLNQAPVDGATDFLYMIATGALSRVLHIDVVTASRWVNIAAQLFSVAILYLAARLLFQANRWLAAAAALYLIAGPFTSLANACFGAPVLGLFLLACWCAGLRYAQQPGWLSGFSMAVFGLLAGLTRPEGVLVAFILLAAVLYLTLEEAPARACLPAVVSFVLVFGLLGGAYFLCHWHYFGYPLPNPFYVKGDGHLYPVSVEHTAMNLVVLLLPVLPLLPLGLLSPSTRRLSLALAAVLAAFTLMWILLNNGSNHFERFQYPIVPLVLLTAPALAAGITARWSPPQWSAWPRPQTLAVLASAALAVCAAMFYASRIADYRQTAWGMRIFARRLAPLAPRGYTMAVTEAGALPLYSGWNTVDGIGLNDSFVAHHRELTAAYLDRYHPELIMVHIDPIVREEFLPGAFQHPPVHGFGGFNTEFLNYYAATHHYTLAAVWGADQCNLHLYWLRPDFPDYATVLSDIRDHPYIYLDNATLSHDFRNEMDSLKTCAMPVAN